MEDEPSCVAAADEEDDGFFVPHGYLSEDEGNLLSDEEMVSRVPSLFIFTVVTVTMVTG